MCRITTLQDLHQPTRTISWIRSCFIVGILVTELCCVILFREMSSSNPSPDSWKGNMSVSYQTGPGFSASNWRLKMQTNMVNLKKTYYSVSGAIRGNHEPGL
jgi:hypothetical protein